MGLSALNRRIVVVENNFNSLESVAIEGLDEVKNNLVELEDVQKEGLSTLELKLNEAISSLQREVEELRRQVDEAAETGVAPLLLSVKSVLRLSNLRNFVGKGVLKTWRTSYGKWMLILSMWICTVKLPRSEQQPCI